MFPADTRILVVDDVPTMRSTIKSHLRGMGFTHISETENGAKAHELILDAHGKGEPFQLILSDWDMPEMTGIELLRKVRGMPDLKDLPFVLIASEGAPAQVKEAIAAGVTHFIVKPFQLSTLSEKILAAWKRHSRA